MHTIFIFFLCRFFFLFRSFFISSLRKAYTFLYQLVCTAQHLVFVLSSYFVAVVAYWCAVWLCKCALAAKRAVCREKFTMWIGRYVKWHPVSITIFNAWNHLICTYTSYMRFWLFVEEITFFFLSLCAHVCVQVQCASMCLSLVRSLARPLSLPFLLTEWLLLLLLFGQ